MPAVQGTVWGALSIWDKGIAGLHYLLVMSLGLSCDAHEGSGTREENEAL